MKTNTNISAGMKRSDSHSDYNKEGLGTKKTALIIVTVVGCIAILWPKVFYPMMFGSLPSKSSSKEPRLGGCCEVSFEGEKYLNATSEIGPQLHYQKMNIHDVEMSIRQERPSHLHPESIYMAMRERGRAIPSTPSIPIVERRGSPNSPPPRIVDGRPGPIPGMRPPMGAGSFHHPQPKGNTMGFIMPLYTIGIIVFFGYTIMKLVFKKQVPNAPYGNIQSDSNFRKDVFGQENTNSDDKNKNKLGWRDHQTIVTAIQGLIDAADEELKLRENKSTPETLKSYATATAFQQKSARETNSEVETTSAALEETTNKENSQKYERNLPKHRKNREDSIEKTVSVLGMEITASCEGGQKWTGRPPTPVFGTHSDNTSDLQQVPEPQEIFLEGALAHETQILVSDSETKLEETVELNGTPDEPAVVLSSKMTLSLINLDQNLEKSDAKNEMDCPSFKDQIEIVGNTDM